jgi:predicted outer membrane repeat protein
MNILLNGVEFSEN